MIDVIRDGGVVYEPQTLEEIRERTLDTLDSPPVGVRAIEDPEEYPVDVSHRLATTTERVRSDLRAEIGL